MKLRISITQKNDEMKGTVALEGDLLFGIEALALALAVETLAKSGQVEPQELAADLYRLVAGKVT